MNREQQIDFIRQKCIEANPAKTWRDTGNCQRHWADDFDVPCTCTNVEYPVRLADVLLTIRVGKSYSPDELADLVGLRADEGGGMDLRNSLWKFRFDDLREQSEETINFIYNLLQ